MAPSIIARQASNWVDRGEPALPRLCQLLGLLYDRREPEDLAWREEHATIVMGMIGADVTESQLRAYLRTLAPSGTSIAGDTLVYAIALWHVGKAALVRDGAERLLGGLSPANTHTHERLSDWMAPRLLSPEELTRHQAERAETEGRDHGPVV